MKHCSQKNTELSNIETDTSNSAKNCIFDNPKAKELWNRNAATYNALAEQMQKAGVDMQLLINYARAAEAWYMGCDEGAACK